MAVVCQPFVTINTLTATFLNPCVILFEQFKRMKITLLRTTFLVSFIAVAALVKTNTGGPGWSYTHAPVTGTTRESNCTGCHGSFSLQTSGSNHNRISLRNNFTGNGYIPDSTYTLVLGYRETGKSKFGFQMTCLEETSYSPAGTFTNGDSRSQTGTAVVNNATRYYIGHTSSGTASVVSDSTSWRIQWKAPNRNVGRVVFWVVLNVTDGGSGTNNDYVYSKSFTVSPSTLLPTAKVKILDANICANNQLSFAADVTGSPTSYSWTFPSGTPASSTSATPRVSYSNAGTYRAILTVRNNKGASRPDTLSFTVKAGPALPVISPSGTQQICAGDSIRLSTTPVSGVSYRWSNNETRQAFHTKDSGSYSVTITSLSNGCTRSSTSPVRIVVNPVPAIRLEKSFTGDTICKDATFTLNARTVKGPADSFSFTAAAGPYTKDSSAVKSFSSGPATVTAWVKSSRGCRSSANINIQVQQPKTGPLAGISARQLSSFRVNWNAVPGATAYKVSTDSGKTFIDPSSGSNGLSHDVTGLIAGQRKQIRIKALLNDVCGETETISIEGRADTCSALPFTLSTGQARTCKGAQAQVTISGMKGRSIAVKVDGQAAGNDTILFVTMTGTRSVAVEVMDNARTECGYTLKRITLVEDTIDIPVTSLSGSSSKLFCSANQTETLQVTVNPSVYRDSVLWYKNNNLASRSVSGSHTFSVSNGDSVWALSVNTRGCSARTPVTRISMPGIPNASFTAANNGYDYTFTANDTNGSHTWNGPGGSGASGKVFNVNLSAYKGTSVKIYHQLQRGGCTGADSLNVAVVNLGLRNGMNKAAVTWFPNPAGQWLTVKVEEPASMLMTITDPTGKVVYTETLKSGDNKLNLAHLAPGSYLIQISNGEKSTSGSIIIQR